MASARCNTLVAVAFGIAALNATAGSKPGPHDAPDPDFLEYLAQHDEPGVPLPEPLKPEPASATDRTSSAPPVVKKP